MATENTSEIGFEKQIWEAANELRGSMSAADYKHVVLGLIFLKYLSDKFEERYNELLEIDDGKWVEDIDWYRSENVFFVPPEARWEVIAKKAHSAENGVTIDNAMRAIEKNNDSLKGILPKNFASQDIDKKRLGNVIDLFTNVAMADHGDKKDILGRTYEYCLAMFASSEGQRAGEFYTPACVVKTLVAVLQPYEGRVYDPCCGSGGMFVQSKNFIESHAGNIDKISIYGQEFNAVTWKMAKMNLAIRGLEADLGEHYADTFSEDLHRTLKADYVLANPPFNLKKWGQEGLQDDVRWKYGIPPKNNANFAWMQHMIHHLSPKGKIGLVLANGSLSSTTGGEGKIRQAIVEDDLVECIVALPTQLFYTTGIPVCLWFLNRRKKQPGKTLFIDARELGTMVSRKLRELTEDDINIIADTFNKFQEGTLEDEKGFCKVSDLEEIKKHDFILTPGRYVGFKPEADDGIPFEEKMEKLTTELGELFKESDELQDKIRKSLKEIGFEF